MKKFLSFFLVGLMLALSLVALVGCKNDPNEPDEPVVMLDIIADGATEYRITRSDYANSAVKAATTDLRNGIHAVTGVKLEVKTDWDDKDNNADIKEILIGKTERKESVEVYEQLAGNQYAIVVSGNKIVIAGATDELLAFAVETFLADYAGYISEEEYMPSNKLSLASNLKIIADNNKSSSAVLYITNEDLTYVDALYQKLNGVVDSLELKTLNDEVSTVFDAEKYGVVIVAGANVMPSSAGQALLDYMGEGGRVLLLGGPAFETILYDSGSGWMTEDEAIKNIMDNLTEDQKALFFDTSSASNVNKITRNAPNKSIPCELKVADYGHEDTSRQLYYSVESVEGYDNIFLPVSVRGEYNAIGFWVKSDDPNTDNLYLEVVDTAGCRWSSGVSVTTEWEYRIVYASDLPLRSDSKASEDTVVDIGSLSRMCIGFEGNNATSKSFMISEPSLLYLDSSLDIFHEITLDHVAPMYEQYPITNAANVFAGENQVFVSERDYVVPETLISCHPGRQGTGYDKNTNHRFIPLLRVTDEKGLHSGYAAWLTIYSSTSQKANGALEGSMLGCFSAVSDDFYDANGIAAVVETVQAMSRNSFLVDGGTTEYTYVAEDTDTIMAGANFINLDGVQPDGLVTKVELYSGNKLLETISSEKFSPTNKRNGVKAVAANYELTSEKPDRAVATLTLDGVVIDKIEQEINYWSAKPENERSFVYMENGSFMKDGKPISFFGVNYMPSYGMAETAAMDTNEGYFEHYVSNESYDRDVVRYDLQHIKDIGMNAISIFVYYDYMKDCNNILDMISLAEEMGIYVNLSIRRNCYPLQNFNAEETEVLIKRLHFYENDNIVGFDIAWEPRIGNYDGNWSPNNKRQGYFIGRQAWDDDWTEWVKTQYGSIAHAEELWGCKVEYTAEKKLYVSDAMLDDQSGKYTKMINAYYRFVDDQIAKEMIDGINLMQEWAPNGLFTFRMSMSGSGLRTGSYMPSTFCFDFQSLASTLAYMEPEGYALDATPEKALQIPIANAYARYVNPNTPVVWKEFGRQVWDKSRTDCNFNQSQSMMNASAAYYEYALEYMLESYTSGVYAWFYAGGFRIGEDSDYGIINPDGSDRPMTTLLREYAPLFINQGARPETEAVMEIERDNQLGGIFGIYEAAKEQAREYFDDGLYFDFVDANQTEAFEKVYADEVYTAAVGGTAEEGLYPLRYVNGMIKQANVVEKNGKTYVRFTICNTKQSTWRAGTVSLVSTDNSDIEFSYTFTEDIDYLENVTFEVAVNGDGFLDLRFEIEDVLFGPEYTVEIE